MTTAKLPQAPGLPSSDVTETQDPSFVSVCLFLAFHALPTLQFPALDGSHSPHFPLLCLGHRRQSSAQGVPGHSLLPLLSKLSKHLKWSRPSHLDPQSPHPPPPTWPFSLLVYHPRHTALMKFTTHPSGSPHRGQGPASSARLEPPKGRLGVTSESGPSTQQRRHWKLLAGQASGCVAKGPKGTCRPQNPE